MHLTARDTGRDHADEGFSLLEAVIAATLLLVTITAVTTCVAGVSNAGSRLAETMDRDRALRRVSERLCALPFCAGSPAQAGAGAGDPAGDLVATLFPHASPGQNTPAACYVTTGGDDTAPAGSFITVLTEDGVPVTCVARFLTGPDGPVLGPFDLAGWDAASGVAPPAPTLSVVLMVEGGTRSVALVRSAMDKAHVAASAAMAGAG